jgi:hypothetical protein
MLTAIAMSNRSSSSITMPDQKNVERVLEKPEKPGYG